MGCPPTPKKTPELAEKSLGHVNVSPTYCRIPSVGSSKVTLNTRFASRRVTRRHLSKHEYSEFRMIIGLLMLLVPIAIYLATFPFSRKLKPGFRQWYRVVGGIIVLVGSATSFYFAAYSGDQGGITAFYFQIVVIVAYVSFSALLVTVSWLTRK